MRTTARAAGITFLVYIAAGVTLTAVPVGPVPRAFLAFAVAFSALTLGVTLWRITRDEDPELALLAMACRVAEGVIGAAPLSAQYAVRTGGAVGEQSAVLVRAAGALNITVTATFFAVGSALFAYLLLRGRLVPAPLASLGVAASVLLVVCLPVQLGGALPSVVGIVMWLPMLVFELWLAVWLIVRGVAVRAPTVS